MAKKPKGDDPKPDALTMISRLLALHLIKGMEKDDAALQLGAVGFEDKSVAEMVGLSESSVRGVRFRRSKKRSRKNRKR
jgi:hypothetical protein